MGHVGGAGERGGVPERSLHRGPVGGWARAAVGVVGTMGRVVMRVWGTWGPDVGGGPVGARGVLSWMASVACVRERGLLKMRAGFEGGRRIGPRGVVS